MAIRSRVTYNYIIIEGNNMGWFKWGFSADPLTGQTGILMHRFDTRLNEDDILKAFEIAGQMVGLCDWRPAMKGPYGTFSVQKA